MSDVKYYVFFDFEMLCSNRGMLQEEMEAIRLGAVKYELATEKVTSFDAYIRPLQQKKLTPFCKQLTGIQDSDLVGAQTFDQVFSNFLTWVGGVKKTRFFSWSKSDLQRLKLDSQLHDISIRTVEKIENRYVDFQAILTKRVTKENLSVQNALELYDMTFVGEQHNPMYDAFNTLRIYLNFLNYPIKSDLLMIDRYILQGQLKRNKSINEQVKQLMKLDLESLLVELHDMYRLRNAQKLLKKVKRLVKKYENISINRSGIFNDDLIESVSLLKVFYDELRSTYNYHFKHAAKIMIIDEHLVSPIKQLAV
ncbi:3'-5' exonuclease [Aquibacillus kalidii]|uniref:3'-5' exonuclease n=1 Tax=Aquibacillus kalidii TaxID=2762597 RepID=UPI0016491EDE|nr:3'-5' exonuclease [Aquibacillus kalidii]